MKQYLDLLTHVLTHGQDRKDRTGVGTRGVFGYQMRMNMADGFPILTTKKVFWKGVVIELLWFLRGDTNVEWLQKNGVHIWDEWADSNGDLGPVYGKQWRRWECNDVVVDQIDNLVRDLKNNPFSRRHIVSAWNPPDVPKMKLPPCHTLWQCYVHTEQQHKVDQAALEVRTLSLHLYARSIDSFLGLPFNIASYALLLHILADFTGMIPGELIISFGDLHIYQNHMDQVREQLSRTPAKLPTLALPLRTRFSFNDYTIEDFKLLGYEPQAAIRAPVAV